MNQFEIFMWIIWNLGPKFGSKHRPRVYTEWRDTSDYVCVHIHTLFLPQKFYFKDPNKKDWF